MSFVAAGLTLGKQVEFSLPGGDAFCARPVDLHLDSIVKSGAKLTDIGHGRFRATPFGRHPFNQSLAVADTGPSVGATCTALILASAGQSKSVLTDYAVDPQVLPVIHLLRASGCSIHLTDHAVTISRATFQRQVAADVPIDRVVLINVAALAAVCGGPIEVTQLRGTRLDIVSASILSALGLTYRYSQDSVTFFAPAGVRPITAVATPFPGLSTDVLPILAAASGCADGDSKFADYIYPSRTSHLPLLEKFGIESSVEGRSYTISGRLGRIVPAKVEPTDVRAASAALLVALTANGTSLISNYMHIARGYEDWVNKLRGLSAKVELVVEGRGRHRL